MYFLIIDLLKYAFSHYVSSSAITSQQILNAFRKIWNFLSRCFFCHLFWHLKNICGCLISGCRLGRGPRTRGRAHRDPVSDPSSSPHRAKAEKLCFLSGGALFPVLPSLPWAARMVVPWKACWHLPTWGFNAHKSPTRSELPRTRGSTMTSSLTSYPPNTTVRTKQDLLHQLGSV